MGPPPPGRGGRLAAAASRQPTREAEGVEPPPAPPPAFSLFGRGPPVRVCARRGIGRQGLEFSGPPGSPLPARTGGSALRSAGRVVLRKGTPSNGSEDLRRQPALHDDRG